MPDMLRRPVGGPPSFALRAVLLAALAGCRGEAPADRPAGQRDVTERPATVTLTIGGVEGAGADVFGRVGGVAVDAEGRIYVADAQAAEIRVFDQAGELLHRFGREGQGPGELSGPCCLAFGPEGLLWVRDGGNARYTAFRVGGDSAVAVETRRMAHGDVNRWAPVTFDAQGRLVDVGTGYQPGTTEPRLGRFRLGEGGEVVEEEILETPGPEELGAKVITSGDGGAGTTIAYFWPPHGRLYLTTHGPEGRWAEAFNSAYEVRVHAPGQGVGMIRGPRIAGPPLSAEERTRAQERIDADRQRAGTDLGFTVPERKQPLRNVYFDTEGRLWVELSVEPGADRRADLFGTDGRLIERRTWPAAVELSLPAWIGDSVAVGVATDSLGVQSVVRLAW